MYQFLKPKVEKRRPDPDGKCGYYFIHGKPNLVFFLQWKSHAWLDLKKAEQTGEIYAMFPKTPAARAATGMTKKMLKEMTNQFDDEGCFKTRNLQVAQAAFKASDGFGFSTYVDEHSLPVPMPEIVVDPIRGFDDQENQFEYEKKTVSDESEEQVN